MSSNSQHYVKQGLHMNVIGEEWITNRTVNVTKNCSPVKRQFLLSLNGRQSLQREVNKRKKGIQEQTSGWIQKQPIKMNENFYSLQVT